MTLIRCLCPLLPPLALACLAMVPVGLGAGPVDINRYYFPQQGYAAVDISGTSTNGGSVGFVALDDANNAAFAFWDGDTHKVGRWSNGALEAGSPKVTASRLLTADFTYLDQWTLAPAATLRSLRYYLNAAGDIGMTGVIEDWTYYPGTGRPSTATWVYGQEQAYDGLGISDGTPNAWSLSHFEDFEYGFALLADGSLVGGGPLKPAIRSDGVGQVARGGNVPDVLAFFGEFTTPGAPLPDTSTSITAASPAGNLGITHGTAGGAGQSYLATIGGGLTLVASIPAGGEEWAWVSAVNDQRDALVSAHDGFYLIEQANVGQKQYLMPNGPTGAALIPKLARPQLRYVTPFLLSNRRVPVGAALQPVLYVLFGAQVQRPGSGDWQGATFLLRKLSDGTTDLHEIAGLDQIQPLYIKSINSSGIIAAIGQAPGAAPGDSALLLLPVDLAVDADRNGLVEFDRDVTSPQRPLRFWVNDDYDHDENGEDPGGVANGSDSAINGIRDLEDFTQVKFRLPRLLADLVKTGQARLGFKWRDVAPGGPMPVARLWSGSPNLDRPTYLKDAGVAQQVVSANNSQPTGAAGTASLTQGIFPTWLRAGVMNTVAADAAGRCTVNLLMEGVDVGAARLTLVVKVNGVESEGPAVDLKLLHVRQMYERGKVSLGGKGVAAPDIPDPWSDNPTALEWMWDPRDWPPDVDPFAEEKTIAFVHGWRMTYGEYYQWADTTYKRLWQLGYQGRFYSFRWPTYSGETIGFDPVHYYKPGGFTYNHSEYRAWLCGPALASFVNGLPNPTNRYLIAHSMGNVTSGSALLSGMQVTRYAMCNAAMAAMAYNGALLPDDPGYQTPDTDADPGTRQTFGLANKLNPAGTEIINFSLPGDSALGQWSANNQSFKPQPLDYKTFFLHHYAYLPMFPPTAKLQYGRFNPNNGGWIGSRMVTALPEAMGYVTQSRTRAAGARQDTLPPDVTVKMDEGGMEFDKEHSAQWVYSIQRTYLFWRRVAEEFRAADLTNR